MNYNVFYIFVIMQKTNFNKIKRTNPNMFNYVILLFKNFPSLKN